MASASSPYADPDPLNNDGSDDDSSVTTTVGGIDLTIQKTLASDSEGRREAIWELVVSNVGTMPTNGTITVCG